MKEHRQHQSCHPAPASGSHRGHDKHRGHSAEMFLRKLWLSALLTVPVVLYSDIFETIFAVRAPAFPFSEYLPFVFGSVVFFYGGLVFIRGALDELKARLPGMMTLISLAIVAAYIYSVGAVLFGSAETLFWELTTLVTIMLLGHWLEMRAVAGAQGALGELAKLLPDTAEVVREGRVEVVPLGALRAGDMVLVRPGAKIPADGTIIQGASSVNEAAITGESKPVEKKPGETAVAGTVNGDGSLRVRVDKVGESTFLAGVMRLVAQAQASKSRLQILSDRAALYLTFIAVAVGLVTFSAWFLIGAGIVVAVTRLVAVLVIACPHALGLAVPLVASISTTKAARGGLLVRERLALEAARQVDVVLFDKTGTLTKGEFGVDAVLPLDGFSADGLVRQAASLNGHSEHPLAKAMVAEAKRRNLSLEEAADFSRLPGKGARGVIGGEQLAIGNEAMLADYRLVLPAEAQKKVSALAAQGKTVVHLVAGNRLAGSLALADVIREESREAVKALHQQGLQTAMITGDSEEVARFVADKLGIDEYFAKVLPQQKVDKVKTLQSRGKRVAMVGDGVNDAPALTQADLGIAIGAGTNVAIESAGIILVKNDPRDIVKIIKLSRLTYRKMMQNLFWATGYNLVALPLAAGALAFKGILLEPAVAAVLMSLSTVIVAVNALLLRRQEL